MPNGMTNKSIDMDALAYILAGAAPEVAGPGTLAAGVGPPTQQVLRARKYSTMVKELLAAGGKLNMDKESFSLKAPMSVMGEGFDPLARTEAGGGTPAPKQQLPAGVPPGTAGAGMNEFALMSLLNPSASPLDISGVNLAGLTVEDISSALQTKFAVEKMRMAETAAVPEAAYLRARTAAITPSIDVPGLGKLTTDQFIKWYGAASEGEKATAIEVYEYYVDQEVKMGRTPKTFEQWSVQAAQASGMGLGEFLARVVGKERVTTEAELAGPDFVQSVREDLMKDRQTWGYPSGFADYVKKGYSEEEALVRGQNRMTLERMDERIRSFYKGKSVEKRSDGWYVNGVLKVRNPYARD